MTGFWNELKVQRWDDHRYYHHSKVNQSLHFVSATSFLFAYVIAFSDPAMAALIGWLVAMTSRQVGHLFFEPRGYDQINQATDEYKEEIKVGYNIKRKLVLLAMWAASPLLLVVDPTLLGIFTPHADTAELSPMSASSGWWSASPASPSARPAVHPEGLRTGLVWATKIATDPFHDIKLYHRAPLELLTGRYTRHTAEAVAAPIIADEIMPDLGEEISTRARAGVKAGRLKRTAPSLAGMTRYLRARQDDRRGCAAASRAATQRRQSAPASRAGCAA